MDSKNDDLLIEDKLSVNINGMTCDYYAIVIEKLIKRDTV